MDRLLWSIISEEAEDSVVDKALSRASEESDYDIGYSQYATISANENDDVPNEYDNNNIEDYNDIDITSDILSDIPSNAEIPEYDDVDIAMASDTEEDSSIIDDDFDEDPEGIEVFYNDNFSASEPIDNSDEKYIPEWVNKMEKEIEVYDRLQETYILNKQKIIDSAHSIEDYFTLERANLL